MKKGKENGFFHNSRVEMLYYTMTYSDITVAIAAPPIPKPKKNIKIGSRIALSRFPAPANRKHVLDRGKKGKTKKNK